MKVKKSIRLECKSGGHNKFYEIEVREDGLYYETIASYGRIGYNPQIQQKYHGTSLGMANDTFNDLKKEKIKKGYTEVQKDTDIPVKTVLLPKQPQPVAVKATPVTTQKHEKAAKDEDVEEDRFDNLDL